MFAVWMRTRGSCGRGALKPSASAGSTRDHGPLRIECAEPTRRISTSIRPIVNRVLPVPVAITSSERRRPLVNAWVTALIASC